MCACVRVCVCMRVRVLVCVSMCMRLYVCVSKCVHVSRFNLCDCVRVLVCVCYCAYSRDACGVCVTMWVCAHAGVSCLCF